jgi:hypothetical protein
LSPSTLPQCLISYTVVHSYIYPRMYLC